MEENNNTKKRSVFRITILTGAFLGFCWFLCFGIFGIFSKNSFLADMLRPILRSFDVILNFIDVVFIKTGILSHHDAIGIIFVSFLLSVMFGLIIGILIGILCKILFHFKSKNNQRG